MNTSRILNYWLTFFRGLFLGTLKNFLLFGFTGFGLGILSTIGFDSQLLDTADWSEWLETLILLLASVWYLSLGVLHGLISCALHVMIQKIREAIEGLQQLLDWITREVIDRIPKFQKNILRSELEEKYDQAGNELRRKLKQEGGLVGLFSGILFGVILKVLKFFFFDQVIEELKKKDSGELTSTDIEHAVRRAGTEVMIAPITDNLFLLHILNIFIGLVLFALPCTMFWLI